MDNNQNNNQHNNQHNNGPMGMPPLNNSVMPQAPAPTNTMAVLSLVFSFLFFPMGIIFGIIGLSQIKKTGEGGKGLAISGIVISSIAMFMMLIWIVFLIIVAIISASSSAGTY